MRRPSQKRYGWLRIYNGFWDHPKWRVVAKMAGARIPEVHSVVGKILEAANRGNPRGSIADFSQVECAASLDLDWSDVTRIYEALERLGWIEVKQRAWCSRGRRNETKRLKTTAVGRGTGRATPFLGVAHPSHRCAMMGGAFWVDRGVFDHPIFRGQEFSEREAWLWLIAEAAWKPSRQRVGRKLVTVARRLSGVAHPSHRVSIKQKARANGSGGTGSEGQRHVAKYTAGKRATLSPTHGFPRAMGRMGYTHDP